jgi:site-specific DNA-methyltransferase (adenine-specific)
MDELLDQVICGDARDTLGELPDACVHTVVTSPPYYRQRDYGTPAQIGQEGTPEEYVRQLVLVFDQVRRVLREDGTLWLNVGDKYASQQLLGLPWRVALALQASGWTLRSDIVWHKANAMPSSVTSRPTADHEYLFLLSRSPTYYYDCDAIREPHVTFTPESRMAGGRGHFGKRGGTPENGKNRGNHNLHDARWDQAFHPLGRNRRTVWRIPLSKFPGAHFAVFPEELVELCVLAGSPPGGVVLDPFLGSGTTAAVAKRLGRRYVGIDCCEEYCAMARSRIGVQEALALG